MLRIISGRHGEADARGEAATLLSTEFRARNHSALEHIDFVIGHSRSQYRYRVPGSIHVLTLICARTCLVSEHLRHPRVQLGPRYEGQLNPMAEPIPHEVRPLVRTHVYHPYQARTDRQRPIVVFNRRGRVFAPFCGCSLKSRECYNHGPRMASS